MPLDSDTLVSGGWCSRRDCAKVLSKLVSAIGNDEEFLDECIVNATSRAKSILRSRWPNDFPFSTPPAELREAVALMAAHRAVRNKGFSGGSVEIVRELRIDAKDAETWVNSVANSEAHFDLGVASPAYGAAVAEPPAGEFGFKE